MTLEEGQVLFFEGDAGKNLYIVRDGELQGTNTGSRETNTYGPGALIGELGLLKNAPCSEMVIATEDSELQIITSQNLNESLEMGPAWFKSIIQFLTERLSIAQSNKHKSDKIKALPSLLYILDSLSASATEKGCGIKAADIFNSVRNLFNIPQSDTEKLLSILEDLEILKVQNTSVHVKNANIVHLLYETIRYRAQHKKAPQQILSMTDQMVLSAVIKTVQQDSEPLKNGAFTVKTADLLKVSRKTLHGVTLTTRTMLPVIERKLLIPSEPIANTEELPELESIQAFSGDFDTVLDLMELNRIYPLLDKKLVK